MKVSEKNVIGDLVAADYRAAKVFSKFNIDFCCQGGRTLEQAAEEINMDSSELIEALDDVMSDKNEESIDYRSWPMDLLVDYIEKKHHRYVDEQIPVISTYLAKVVKVHGSSHPELKEIQSLFNGAANELRSHMEKEETILFPYIREVEANKSRQQSVRGENMDSAIQMLKEEHDQEGERFRKIETLSDQYTPPPGACNTYRVTYALLNEFQENLHKHIHLENNILFPQVKKLENHMSKKAV
jgi:regulator of cell morphogenesis and NO signaling